MIDFVTKLQRKLSLDLPGYDAQKIMEPPLRNTLNSDMSSARHAATMLILYNIKEAWKFILIRRSSHPLDKHKGQISFPGGSLEADESSEKAAFREVEEEIGIRAEQLQLVGKLSSLYIPVSNFKVDPYVAFMSDADTSYNKQDDEVDEILHLSLSDFLDDNNVKVRDLKMPSGFIMKDVPYYNLGHEQIWGATAMMLSEFREICKDIV